MNKLKRNKIHRNVLNPSETETNFGLAPISPMILTSSPLSQKWDFRNFRNSLNYSMIPERILNQFEHMKINNKIPVVFKKTTS